MIGIYKITKKIDGKCYIGQSNNIKRRFREHINRTQLPIEKAIHKYGFDAFEFEVLEECSVEQLDEREKYWIDFYGSCGKAGYNCNEGGGSFNGEFHPGAKMTEIEIEYIRDCYNNHRRKKEVYEEFSDKISFNTFVNIWTGTTWTHIKPEVYTEENKQYYIYENSQGEKSFNAALTDDEVLECRKRYVKETARQIYEDYKERIAYTSFQGVLIGNSYRHLPIYSKRKKEWINK